MGIKRGALLLNGSVTYSRMLPPIFGVSLFFCSMILCRGIVPLFLPGSFFPQLSGSGWDFWHKKGSPAHAFGHIQSMLPHFCSMILCRGDCSPFFAGEFFPKDNFRLWLDGKNPGPPVCPVRSHTVVCSLAVHPAPQVSPP